MNAAWRLLLAALPLGTALACGSTYGDDPAASLDGGSGTEAGTEAAATIDPADGANGANDAGVSEDGAGTTSFCGAFSVKPTFCSDFDDGALPGPWDDILANGNATLRVDRDAYVSGPFSVLARVSASEALRGAGLHVALPVPANRMTVAYDLRVDEFPNAGDSDYDVLFVVFGGDAAAAFEIQTQLNADGTIELHSQGGPGGSGAQPVTVPAGRFTRVSVAVDVKAGKVEMSLDGTTVGSIPFLVPGEKPVLYVGDTSLGKTTASWAVRFDNVVVQID